MPTELLPIGYPVTMVQNIVYAAPVVRCMLFSQSGGTIEQSNEVGFSTAKALTLDTNNQAEVAGGFIRQTSAAGGLVVEFKRM
jgi:hypothetical protein